ncbi:MAG: glycerol kinase GlpK, partial [Synechococcaceae cyanobacterium]|nr:glycerol kinase GlpK [Synechococcaceae cyanobacterium]
LALDQGTTGSTALLIGDDGTIRGRGYREIRQHYPEPGWVEHDPEEIWHATVAAAEAACGGERPHAIGITNQRETIVAWERATGRPVHHAIVWQDRRTAARCRELAAAHGVADLARRTGLVWDPYFSATKIEWLLREVPGLRDRAERGEIVFGTVDAWLIARLSGGRTVVTDHTNASRTLLYDLGSRTWDDTLLDLFGVPRVALPDIVASSGVCATTMPDSPVGPDVPIAGIAGDQQAALFGQGCHIPGAAKNTYGTGAFLLMLVGDHRPEPDGRVLTTMACDARGAPTLAAEGAIFVAGAALQWLRDGLGLIETAAESEALARSVPDTGGVVFVPALVGLGAPHWEADARGTLVGLTRGTTAAHVARAALEAMAYATREVVEAMTGAAGVPLRSLKVDGGAAANDWLMDFQATVLGVAVERPDVVELTAFGAAGLAGMATGIWRDADEFVRTRSYQRFEPSVALGRAAASGYHAWERAVRAALFWARDRA